MADNNTTGKRKRPKAFYVGQKKKKKGQEILTPGMKGVLVTCNEKEKVCIKEAYNVLNEYADQLYGPEHKSKEDYNGSDGDEDSDIEDALAKEVKELQAPDQERRFQAILSGATNVIFLKANLPDSKDPAELVHTALMDMMKTQCKKTRYCQRFLPISNSCYASKEDMKTLATNMFQATFLGEDVKPSKFCVMYKSRNNGTIDKSDTIAMLASIVENAGKGHTVDLNRPDLAICVEIIKNVCCMSVVRDLFKLRKYNVHEINKEINKLQTMQKHTKATNGNNNQDMVKTEGNSCDSGETLGHQTNAENKDVVRKCSGTLNETVLTVDSSQQDTKLDSREGDCNYESARE
ncbi:THUMP domain-containing protein 1-like [Montipora foliosa]|uniref:THUMP domain-containing protein 1-like n=1 Tax=Montipora foliosa TaxID=591990 RepID=UPI0035F1A920